MRRLLPIAALAVSAACWPARQPVPLEVDWTFGGQACTDAGVTSITIDIDGEILTPNTFTCVEASQGVDLGDFMPGPYTVTVTGYDSANNAIFQTTQTIQVRAGQRNVINFDAAATTGTASLRWSFDGKTCAGAGVSTVRVSVDGMVITDEQNQPDLPCKGTVEGTTIGPLSPGVHSFSLAASGNSADYEGDLSVTVNTGQDTLAPINLAVAAPTTASADVRWLFEPGDRNCLQFGADHLYVVYDPQPNGSGGTVVADTACAGMGGLPVTEMSIVDIPDGNHSFAIRATKNNQLIGYTHHPVTTLFSAPFTTAVDVTAESLP